MHTPNMMDCKLTPDQVLIGEPLIFLAVVLGVLFALCLHSRITKGYWWK